MKKIFFSLSILLLGSSLFASESDGSDNGEFVVLQETHEEKIKRIVSTIANNWSWAKLPDVLPMGKTKEHYYREFNLPMLQLYSLLEEDTSKTAAHHLSGIFTDTIKDLELQHSGGFVSPLFGVGSMEELTWEKVQKGSSLIIKLTQTLENEVPHLKNNKIAAFLAALEELIELYKQAQEHESHFKIMHGILTTLKQHCAQTAIACPHTYLAHIGTLAIQCAKDIRSEIDLLQKLLFPTPLYLELFIAFHLGEEKNLEKEIALCRKKARNYALTTERIKKELAQFNEKFTEKFGAPQFPDKAAQAPEIVVPAGTDENLEKSLHEALEVDADDGGDE